MLSLMARTRCVNESTGASLFGPVIADWPGWAFDAHVLIEQAHTSEQNASYEAETRNRRG